MAIPRCCSADWNCCISLPRFLYQNELNVICFGEGYEEFIYSVHFWNTTKWSRKYYYSLKYLKFVKNLSFSLSGKNLNQWVQIFTRESWYLNHSLGNDFYNGNVIWRRIFIQPVWTGSGVNPVFSNLLIRHLWSDLRSDWTQKETHSNCSWQFFPLISVQPFSTADGSEAHFECEARFT